MQDLNDFVNVGSGSPSSITAPQFNQIPSELQNAIEAAGLVLSSSDLFQLAKAALSPSKNVLAYGAAGDGVADDTAAIQSALDDANRDETVLPLGTYNVTGLSVPAGQRLRITPGATLFLIDGSDADVVVLSGARASVILDGTIDGNRANQTANSSTGIVATGFDDCRVEGSGLLTQCADRGIFITDGNRCTISGSLRITLTTRMGIQGLATNTNTLDDFHVVGAHVDRSDDAANDDGCIEVTCNVGGTADAPVLDRCTAIMDGTPTGSNVVPIEFFGDVNVAGSLRDGKVSRCKVVGGNIGVSLASGSAGCVAENCSVVGANQIGIELANSLDNRAVDCTVDIQGKSGVEGIVCNNNASPTISTRRHAISSCTIRNCGDGACIFIVNADSGHVTISGNSMEGSDDDADGVFVQDSSGFVLCTGNTIELSGSGTTQRRGFVFNNSDNCKCLDNQVTNAHRSGQIVANNEAHSNFLVRGNDFVGCTNTGVQILEQGTGSLSEIKITENLPESSNLTSESQQSTTSGTEFDFTGIPSWVKRISVLFNSVSLDGTDDIIVQLGDSGGFETVGYQNHSRKTGGVGVSSTEGFSVEVGDASALISGQMMIEKIDPADDDWVASHAMADGANGESIHGAGRKVLTTTLDRIRITRTGTDSFDGGSVNILYE